MEENNTEKPQKKRSLTEVTLGWIADRLRKAEAIKQSINDGNYTIDSKKLAERIVSKD